MRQRARAKFILRFGNNNDIRLFLFVRKGGGIIIFFSRVHYLQLLSLIYVLTKTPSVFGFALYLQNIPLHLVELMDNTSHPHSSYVRRSKSHIILPIKSSQRMFEHWEFQRTYGDYSWTQVIRIINIQLQYSAIYLAFRISDLSIKTLV